MDNSSTWNVRTVVAFASITLIWGATWIITRGQLHGVPPQWSITYRCLIAMLAVLGAAAVLGQPLSISHKHHFVALWFGVLQFVVNLAGVYAAERIIPSGLVAIIFATLVIPNSLLGWLLLRQRLSAQFQIGSTIAVGGVALLILNEATSSGLPAGELAKGVALAVAAMLAASAANILNASNGVRQSPLLPILGWALGYATIISLVLAWVGDGPPQFTTDSGYWLGLLYLGLGATALAFVLFYNVLRSIGPARAAYANVLFPIIAMLLSTWFEGYRWTSLSVLGAGTALIGLIIALSAPPSSTPCPKPPRHQLSDGPLMSGECNAG